MTTTPVHKLMTTEVARIQLDAPLVDAARLMFQRKLSCLLIDDDCETVGILTERDLTRALCCVLEGKKPSSIREVMTDTLITIQADSAYSEAMKVLQRHKIRRVVVVDEDGKVCGLITRADLLNVQKQVLENEVLKRTTELEETNKALELLSVTDSMLNVGNRRAMDIALQNASNYTKRYARFYSIVLLDIDYFKYYNDFYGHQSGDEVLVKVASTIKSRIRETDSIFRYGGEEFLVLLPETNLPGALIAAENWRKTVENIVIPHEKSPLGIMTASFGVSSLDLTEPNQDKSISQADEALYQAKRNGRNRVEGFNYIDKKCA